MTHGGDICPRAYRRVSYETSGGPELGLHGRPRGDAPPGFYAALLPIAPPAARAELERHLATAQRDGLYGDPPAYYDQNLALFARGFLESRFRFREDGALAPAWETRCLGRAR